MSLLTPNPVSLGDGALGGVTVLDPFVYRDMRPCLNCGGEEVFVEVYEFEHGRVGCCLGCGEERFVAFSRTNSEAA